MNKISTTLLLSLVVAAPSMAQQGGTFTPDTSTMQGTNAGGPVGTQAVDRPTTATPNDVGKRGKDCEQMSGTVSAQRPATAGQQNPQPQQKC